uniref:Uncharacterized protein n=1 Tax=Anguilla anguilla TaxID=7936 RepID=A0A0E9Q3K9_ANGAN
MWLWFFIFKKNYKIFY